MTPKRYCSVEELPKIYPIFNKTRLRRLILGNVDGIKKTMIKVGKRVYFDTDLFAEWLEQQRIDKD